jgi:hypothetical protein
MRVRVFVGFGGAPGGDAAEVEVAQRGLVLGEQR